MNYNDILNKKRDRLRKYTGQKLRRKARAYERACFLYGNCTPTLAPPKSLNPVFIETGTPEWLVTPPTGQTFTVFASSEKKARAEARTVLGVKVLPKGTTVEKA
jgi:hypothetical protein